VPEVRSAGKASDRSRLRDALDILETLGAPVGRTVADLAASGHEPLTVLGVRSYGRLDGLSAIRLDPAGPATYYILDGRVVLAYLPEIAVSAQRLIEHLGRPEADWRSRAGKRYLHHVYAEQGLAFSSEPAGKRVAIVERFEPGSLERYAATFYEDPGRFTE
jgi:hypothetical protein